MITTTRPRAVSRPMKAFVAAIGLGAGAAVVAKPELTFVPLLLGVAVVALVTSLPSVRGDGVSVLSLFLGLLLLLPSRLVLRGLGGVATPAAALGLAALWVWVAGWAVRRNDAVDHRADHGGRLARAGIFAFLGAIIASYAAAYFRPIPGIEASAADRGILIALVLAGVGLLAADGIRDRNRLDVMLQRLVMMATIVAAIGIFQFATGKDPNTWFHLPFLRLDEIPADIGYRSIFRRVASTARHPIEFGTVMSLVFPIALHYGFEGDPQYRRRRLLQVGIIATAVFLSLSRTGAVGLIVAVVVVFPTLSTRRKVNALATTAIFAIGMRMIVPGLLGTMRALFLNIQSDPSYAGRTSDYSVIAHNFANAPIFGRGFYTFIPSQYTFIDNQYLMSSVETGLIGVAALLFLFWAGVRSAWVARRESDDPETRSLALALMASILAAALSCATFDFLSFPTASGLTFVLIGCAGALLRLERTPRSPARALGRVP